MKAEAVGGNRCRWVMRNLDSSLCGLLNNNVHYYSLLSEWWQPLITNIRTPKLIPMNTMSMIIMVTTSDRVSTLNILPPPPPRNGDLVLNGRPRAHQEDPIRALHSPMLQSGIGYSKSGSFKFHTMVNLITNYPHTMLMLIVYITLILRILDSYY